jgi:hypothetical protein
MSAAGKPRGVMIRAKDEQRQERVMQKRVKCLPTFVGR